MMASGCAAPLIFRDRVLGVIGIKSTRPHAFSEEDAELFGQVAKQVAIAVENALAYNEIETLKNKLEKKRSSISKKRFELNTISRRSSVAALFSDMPCNRLRPLPRPIRLF
jgi:GAF domain-containing protein